jgi:hypothetical protein
VPHHLVALGGEQPFELETLEGDVGGVLVAAQVGEVGVVVVRQGP